jgi:hypothetical protein
MNGSVGGMQPIQIGVAGDPQLERICYSFVIVPEKTASTLRAATALAATGP